MSKVYEHLKKIEAQRQANIAACLEHDYVRREEESDFGPQETIVYWECRHCGQDMHPPDGCLLVWADEVVCEK